MHICIFHSFFQLYLHRFIIVFVVRFSNLLSGVHFLLKMLKNDPTNATITVYCVPSIGRVGITFLSCRYVV